MLEFGAGFGAAVVLLAAVVLVLHKVGLLRNHGDVTNQFQAHKDVVAGMLDVIRERTSNRLDSFNQIMELRIKAELDPIKKDLEDARAGILGIDQYLKKLEARLDGLMSMGGALPGEGRQVPADMEVVGGGAIGND